MLHIALRISNPFRKEKFKNLKSRAWYLGYHKVLELELTYFSRTLLEVDAEWTFRQDHAGPGFNIGLFGYSLSAKIYDTRHWQPELGKWHEYETYMDS